MMNSAPNSPNMTRAADEIAAENLLLRKSRGRSIGCEVVRSQTMKTARTASPASPALRTGADDQPRSGASMIDHNSSPSPGIASTAPATSGPSTAGFFESGTSGMAHATPTAAIGTLIRNTDPHQKCVSNRPPTIGPSAMPTPIVPAHRLIARCRSPPSRKMSVMIDSVEGIISAAPMPMLARAASSTPTAPAQTTHPARAADALAGRGGDQQADGAGEGRPCRADGESGQASQERPFTPDPVGQASGHQHQPGEDHDVRVDYPLQLAGTGVQVTHQRRQRDIENRVVQVHHQQRHAQDSERQPAPRW